MNCFGHAAVASWKEGKGGLPLGTMLPDFTPMCGARVTGTAGGRARMQEVGTSQGLFSTNDPRLHFGLGNVPSVDSVVVRWPDGLEEAFEGIALDQALVLRRGEGRS